MRRGEKSSIGGRSGMRREGHFRHFGRLIDDREGDGEKRSVPPTRQPPSLQRIKNAAFTCICISFFKKKQKERATISKLGMCHGQPDLRKASLRHIICAIFMLVFNYAVNFNTHFVLFKKAYSAYTD